MKLTMDHTLVKLAAGNILNKRFKGLSNFISHPKNPQSWMSPQSLPLTYQSKKQGVSDMNLAAQRAQQMNVRGGGQSPVYYSISEPTNYTLDQTFAYLASKSNKEISVSVEKGVWNSSLVLAGRAKLLMYYTKDVSTNYNPQGQLIPIQAYAPESHSHYDEAIIRLSDVTWSTLYIGGNTASLQAFGGVSYLKSIAAKYRLQVSESVFAPANTPIGKTYAREQQLGIVRKDT